jgi:hypothetical protein
MAIPSIINVAVITNLFFLIFGIIGVSYLKGASFKCQKEDSLGLLVTSKWDCLDTGGVWKNNQYTFDDIFSAMFSLFIMSTTVGWEVTMYEGIAIVGKDMEP